jgi:hypothetical protein
MITTDLSTSEQKDLDGHQEVFPKTVCNELILKSESLLTCLKKNLMKLFSVLKPFESQG